MQSYKTVSERTEASFVEKKSEFIAVAAPVCDEQEALAVLEDVRTRHRTASHNVYAYSLLQENRRRYSDDGEPAKTAGLPVFNVLTGAGVEDCIIVVTRYFGGTLLGTGGLVRAYTAAAHEVLAKAYILTMQKCITLSLTVDYSLYEPIQRLFSEAGARLNEPIFTDKVRLSATLPSGAEKLLLPQLNELCRGNANASISRPFFAPF